jgi:oligopeptide/dipeptide ABC transporter ATP-binding protein
MPEPLLRIRDLRVSFATRAGAIRAVDGVSLDVARGECLGVVGESGSGKSATFLAVMGLLPGQGRIECGSIQFDGGELVGLDAASYRALRGRDIAITLQDALSALNPALTIGTQIKEVLRAHAAVSRRAASERAIEMLRRVGISTPERRLLDYPHQFSGGMRQRIMIAIALCCRPQLLIADEPTTALDATIQAQVLELIATMRQELAMSVVLITHDLGVVAEYCDRVAVMYAGQIVETGPTTQVIGAPAHPYTRGLLASLPRLEQLDQVLRPIQGQVPEPGDSIACCRFLPRCGDATRACQVPIAMRTVSADQAARCVLVEEAVL